MKRTVMMALAAGCLLFGAAAAMAQGEASAPPGPGGTGPEWGRHKLQPGERLKRLREMDTNKDGRVTKDEFVAFSAKRAEELFAKLDRNGDGALSKEDRPEPGPGARAGAGAGDGPGVGGGGAKGGLRGGGHRGECASGAGAGAGI